MLYGYSELLSQGACFYNTHGKENPINYSEHHMLYNDYHVRYKNILYQLSPWTLIPTSMLSYEELNDNLTTIQPKLGLT